MKKVEITNDGEVIIYNDNAVIKEEDVTSRIEGSYEISEDSLRKLLVLQMGKVCVTDIVKSVWIEQRIYSVEDFKEKINDLERKRSFERDEFENAVDAIEKMKKQLREDIRKHNAGNWWNRLKKIKINGL